MGECADDAVFGDMDDEFRIDDDIDFDRYHDQRSRQPQARKVMDKQQHALRLAEWLEESHNSMDKLSAAELRRLHQVNRDLFNALEWIAYVDATKEDYKHKAYLLVTKHKEQA